MNLDRVRQALAELDRALSAPERGRLERYGSVATVKMLEVLDLLRHTLDTTSEQGYDDHH